VGGGAAFSGQGDRVIVTGKQGPWPRLQKEGVINATLGVSKGRRGWNEGEMGRPRKGEGDYSFAKKSQRKKNKRRIHKRGGVQKRTPIDQ